VPTEPASTSSRIHSATPTAAVMLIGSELLSGRTQDTNLAYMAKGLSAHGIVLREARVIPDDAAVIVHTLNALRAANTYVFTTGGIGPTHDDITADCIAKAFAVDIDIHPEAQARLLDYWSQRGIEPNDDRLRMARIPHGADLIDNPVSVAPGFHLGNVFVFAGVPRIMQAMFDAVLPGLQHGPVIGSVSIKCNLGEGTIASPLRDLQSRFPDVDIGSYPGGSANAGLTLVARGDNQAQLADVEQALQTMVERIGGALLD